MSFTFYNYVGLIKPDSKANLTLLADSIRSHYTKANREVVLTLSQNQLLIGINGYTFKIDLQSGPDVLIESKEMVDFKTDYAGNPFDKNVADCCEKRFELSGEEDFDMDFFNDSLYIIQCMEELGGVTVLSLN